MIRFLMPGGPPKNILCSFDMSASDVFAQGAGGAPMPPGHALAVNGIRADAGTVVKPGSTVQVQPLGLQG